jgi:hypothetical protein
MYELLSGRLPFDAESYAHLIVKVRTEQALPLNQIAPQVPVALAQVVMVGLAKEPQQRWQSAREFADALRSALGLPPPGSTPTFLPSQSGAQPALALSEPGGLEKTHTPQPRPSPAVPPPGLAAAPSAAWVVPASGSANTGLPLNATPPPQSGWVLPGAATPSVLQANLNPPQYAPPPPPKKSSGVKWVLGTLGVLFLVGGCCTCGVIVKAASAADEIEEVQPPAAVKAFERAQPPRAPKVTPRAPSLAFPDEPIAPEPVDSVVDPGVDTAVDPDDPDAVESDAEQEVEPAPEPELAPRKKPHRRPKSG